MKKKIGFIDLYLSEWHANNYPAWIKGATEKLSLPYELTYAYAEKDISPVDGISTDEWCATYGVQKCDTIEELCEKSDAIIVLAPSNPEVHLRYAETVLKYKKPTYIDKTFTPDYKTAEKIYAIGEKYGTPFFSSSALRYAEEIEDAIGAQDISLTGGGSNFPEYSIHMIEMLVKTMGTGAESVRAERVGSQLHVFVSFGDERAAAMTFAPAQSFTIYANKEGSSFHKEIVSAIFPGLIESMLKFFESGKLPFAKEETLAAMKLREAALLAADNIGQTVYLSSIH